VFLLHICLYRSVNLTTGSDTAIKVGEELKSFYFGGKKLSDETLPQFIDLLTDYHFGVGQQLTVDLHARYQHK
jgi:hypothetical protein